MLLNVAAVSLLVSSALAGAIPNQKAKTLTEVVCSTKLATTSVRNVKATTRTIQKNLPPVVFVTTVHPQTTVTPKAITLTSTAYATSTSTVTASTITDVFSTTSTEYDTTTVTSTATTTSTVSTDATSTTTVSSTISAYATSGVFEDALDTLDGYDSAAKRSNQKGSQKSTPEGCNISSNNPKPGNNGLYPSAISCTKYLEVFSTKVVTATAKAHTVTAKPKTVTTTSTSTLTTIVTEVPADVSTTLSFSTTSTLTNTASVTVTATTTSTNINYVSTTVSYYPQCTADNVLGPVFTDPAGRSVGVGSITIPTNNVLSYSSASSAAACCALCFSTSGCTGSAYLSGACYYFTSTTCAAQTNSEIFGYTESSYSSGFTISNGPCGYYYETYD